MIFILHFVNIVHHIDGFADIEPFLYPWHKSHLVMVCDPFNVLLDLVCQYFVEDFYNCVHQGYWPVIFFSYNVLVWFQFHGRDGFIQWVWNCSFLFCLFEELEKDWYEFLKCLVEFTVKLFSPRLFFFGGFDYWFLVCSDFQLWFSLCRLYVSIRIGGIIFCQRILHRSLLWSFVFDISCNISSFTYYFICLTPLSFFLVNFS